MKTVSETRDSHLFDYYSQNNIFEVLFFHSDVYLPLAKPMIKFKQVAAPSSLLIMQMEASIFIL